MKQILLPFYFKKTDDFCLLTNIAGEHVFLSPEEFELFVTGQYKLLSSDTFVKLQARQFLTDEDRLPLTENMLAIKLRSRKNYLSYFTSLHMVVLTVRCNCNCDYCHASSKDLHMDNYDMDKKTAKAVVDTIFSTPSPVIKIEFQGGEPVLNWGVLEFIVLEAAEINKSYKKCLSFVICTNLLELSDEQLSFIKLHNINLSTSCDGTKYYHDLHRKARNYDSSYEEFVRNLGRARAVLGGGSVNALLTVTKDNLMKLNEVIDHYYELGFKGIFIRALNPYGYAVSNEATLAYDVEEFIAYYKRALLYIINMNKNGKYFVESYAALLFQRIMTPFSTGFVDLQSPSGAGIAGAIYYYNGDVYPADEARMLAETGDSTFRLGNVKKNSYDEMFDGSIIHDLVWNSCVEALPECNGCAYQQYCGADPVRYYVETKDVIGKRPQSEFCKKNKGILDFLFEIINENNEQTMAVLWSWVHRKPLEEWQICG